MKKNLKTLVERTHYERPRCLINMNRMELVEACGLKVDLHHKRSAHLSGLWKPLERTTISLPLGGADLSPYAYLTFAVFAQSATGTVFEVFFDNAEKGDRASGYTAEVKLEAKGWNFVTLKLPRLAVVGTSEGRKAISYLHLVYKKGRKIPGVALYLDNFYLWENEPPKLYELIPDLKRAVVFSEFGTYALVKGKRVLNSPFASATPRRDESNGEYWVPFYPIVAASVRSAEADNKAKTLTFTYRKHRYIFAADKPWALVDGARQMLKFAPIDEQGCLLVPASYAAEFFSRKYSLAKGGMIVLSNRKNWFLKAGKNLQKELLAATVFPPIDGELLSEKILHKFAGSKRQRLLFTKEEVTELRRTAKGDEAFEILIMAIEKWLNDHGSSLKKRCLSATLIYLANGKKKLAEQIKEFVDMLSPDASDLAEFGREIYVLALAYDALRPILTEAEKAKLESKLLRVSLRFGISYYAGNEATAKEGSLASRSLAAGMIASALAMAEAYPETSRRLLEGALESLQTECLSFENTVQGRADLLLALRSLCLSVGEDCGCLSIASVKGAYAYLFPQGNPIDALLRVYQSTLTKQK